MQLGGIVLVGLISGLVCMSEHTISEQLIVYILASYMMLMLSLVPRLSNLSPTRERKGEPGMQNHVCDTTSGTVVEP